MSLPTSWPCIHYPLYPQFSAFIVLCLPSWCPGSAHLAAKIPTTPCQLMYRILAPLSYSRTSFLLLAPSLPSFLPTIFCLLTILLGPPLSHVLYLANWGPNGGARFSPGPSRVHSLVGGREREAPRRKAQSRPTGSFLPPTWVLPPHSGGFPLLPSPQRVRLDPESEAGSLGTCGGLDGNENAGTRKPQGARRDLPRLPARILLFVFGAGVTLLTDFSGSS